MSLTSRSQRTRRPYPRCRVASRASRGLLLTGPVLRRDPAGPGVRRAALGTGAETTRAVVCPQAPGGLTRHHGFSVADVRAVAELERRITPDELDRLERGALVLAHRSRCQVWPGVPRPPQRDTTRPDGG